MISAQSGDEQKVSENIDGSNIKKIKLSESLKMEMNFMIIEKN